MYRIKGTGSRRDVFDGITLIGVIERHEREVVNEHRTYRNGVCVSVTVEKRAHVFWTATRTDGTHVRRRGKRWSRTTMKAWKHPAEWQDQEAK